ncbi:hypothetical protein KR215_011927, partial [Drosophila sulfurigaster]
MTAKHGLLVPPFLWEDGVPNVHEVDFGGRHGGGGEHDWTDPGRMTVVAQLVMLTDAEFAVATSQGLGAVQRSLLDTGTDLNDVWRKYRPATFAEVVGQEHVTEPLCTSLDSGRINHAYLFSGPRGCGKTSSARILARSLNCV